MTLFRSIEINGSLTVEPGVHADVVSLHCSDVVENIVDGEGLVATGACTSLSRDEAERLRDALDEALGNA